MSDGSEPAGAQRGREDEIATLREQLDAANQKLVDSHKMASLGRLSAGVVHEIRTPIGSIFSNNEVILRSLEKLKTMLQEARTRSTPPSQQSLDVVDIIVGLAAVDKIACERISSVIRSLKTFARVNEGDLARVDINELLTNTIKLTGTVFRRRIETQTEFGDLPPVECYPGLMNQVFLNLVVNAGQAIEDEGVVTVRTRLEGDEVHISVSDTGRGIPPEVRGRIFAAGFTTKPIGEGTGLGLSITREIVEDTHGGKIWFDTEQGKGTTFHVRIPIEQRGRSAAWRKTDNPGS
ncbi:MAG TPA: ATP-binding protein [Bryobacteraceae bacterium]|nr:ATP-binding protein [Bryobacteraceae bacterium]